MPIISSRLKHQALQVETYHSSLASSLVERWLVLSQGKSDQAVFFRGWKCLTISQTYLIIPVNSKVQTEKKKGGGESPSSTNLLENYDAYLPRPFSSMYMGEKYV